MDERLGEAGIDRVGEVEQPHLRPWSTILTAPTTGGAVWMKAAGSANAFEAPLYELLARVAPEHVLTPLAVDATRGWMLLPDGGQTLGDSLDGPELVDAMVEALTEYGRLQRELSAHAGELLAIGVADMRPAVMPERFVQALDAAPAMRAQIAPLEGTVAGWCERLERSPLPASLDHNDLHPWNILPGGPGRMRFYDWGDAVVAHPLAAALVPLGFVQQRLGVTLDDPAYLRARDAYLGVFADLAPSDELAETLELACNVAKIARALIWERALRAARDQGEQLDALWENAVEETLALLLDDSYLGWA